MVTIHREQGLRFAILTNDHEPAHVHVYGDGAAKISIRGADGLPELVYVIGMKATERRRAMDIVLERQEVFLVKWHAIHGEAR